MKRLAHWAQGQVNAEIGMAPVSISVYRPESNDLNR